jgi:hypothetical protein
LLSLQQSLGLNPDLTLKFSQKCMVELAVNNDSNVVILSPYFDPDFKVNIINKYLKLLENILYTLNCCVLLLGDFNVSRFN